MLYINDLSIQYDKKQVVNNFSLKVNKGEIVSIVGESGSGKSTSIKAILGILPSNARITNGIIEFQGKNLLNYKKEQWNEIRSKKISMIFQDSGNAFNPIRKIGSVFIEYIRTHSNMSKRDAYEKAVEMLRLMELPDCDNIMKSYPFQLSGGMRQRVSIAMAMTFKVDLLLADEPTSALDVTTQAQIVRQMMKLRENYNSGIIMVTHNMGVAAYMSDKIIVMKDGCIIEAGDKNEIIKSPTQEYTKELIDSIPDWGGDMIA
ncbi:ABC transporter ATP-binding protein [Tissierella sp. Yu-01]|uniref:ABC transporter ATP-binding protein n=1 Tax=Tissierella sp. Yu-01 TaxID=3035694 RepID=UPI00240E635D|nr:ABC transporter ATP-binding protein [Tissierella sp. Yu-01]WFA09308.1 ABC transporter ATP-binding protein [Tissierella sp. Yu-01]